ncbi:MAG: phosphoribosylamine--glycine ligase [Burkholderiales bacterium]|nr:phosphoribosylamine--glycine ligase [Burkholderiales bacterium]
MKILVIGSGGREHALAWKLAQSKRVSKIYVAPGNAGTAREDGVFNVPITAIDELVKFAREEEIALTVVGPEAPLAEGVVDAFRNAGLKIFGPTRAAARLEWSKDFAKQFMRRHGVPTAAFETFTDAAAAKRYIAERGAPIVVKADGLAAGKGVVVAGTIEEAQGAVDAMFGDNVGQAGHRVVVEDFVDGEEASFIVMVDGHHVLPLATSQDHKRLLDNDLGANTGGMGAYSPAPVITPEVHGRVMREVIMPTVQGMAEDGVPYTGFLYAGLMIDGAGAVTVLEFNCRLGDPETQPIMMRLKSDLTVLIEQAINGHLAKSEAEWDRRTALGVVLAAAGYPNDPRKGDVIDGLPTPTETVRVFHAGTSADGDTVLTAGGRVLCVTALGDNVKIARHNAYEVADRIHFPGAQLRRDIGWRAIGGKK